MELKLEYDILLLSDHEQILGHLKDSAKRMWIKAASVPFCRPINTKISIIPQAREQKNDNDNFEIRYPKLFDFSFKIPNGNYEDKTDHILAEKKLAYGEILKLNEDARKLELEIANVDPSKIFDPANYIVPTIASVFAEHEVLGFQQLRFIKIREFRIKLLRQLNWFRSIEKRIIMDLPNVEHKAGSKNESSYTSALAEMYMGFNFRFVKQEFFEIGGKNQDKFKSESLSEDLRTIINEKIYITDKKGVNIVYGKYYII